MTNNQVNQTLNFDKAINNTGRPLKIDNNFKLLITKN